jgi:hypothetical protein
MEEQHAQLFDLIASKSFDQLTAEENTFVLQHLSEQEYRLQQKIMNSASELEFENEEPLPLVLPSKKRFLAKSIPLYQAMLGAAAMLLLFFAIWPNQNQASSINLNFGENPLTMALPGTTSVQIIHDTIVQRIPMVKTISAIVYDTITLIQERFKQPETRQLVVGKTLTQPEITQQLLESKSQSYKDDKIAQILPHITIVNTMK